MSFTQGLFWKNLPSKKIKNSSLKIFTHLEQNTFFKKVDAPALLYTGTNNIDFSDLYKDPKLLSKLRKRSPQVFLYEPVSYYIEGSQDHSLGYYSEFHSKHNLSGKVRADELDSIQKFAKDIGTIVTVHSCDYQLNKYVGQHYPNLKLLCNDLFLRQACLSWMPDVVYNRNITKPFWCGNGRYTIHRHIIMSYLADKPGNYSWHFKSHKDFDSNNWAKVVDWVEDINLKEGSELLDTKSFSLDFKTEPVEVLEKNGHYMPDGPFSSPNINYRKSFLDSFVCIINETRFAQPTGNVSEKVIDAINYANPFILVAPPKSLEMIKKIGIKTFSDFWDESYDQEENHNKRMKMIFNLIDEINEKSVDELNAIYKQMIPILKHNREIIKKYKDVSRPINDS